MSRTAHETGTDRVVTLADGRILGYADIGDPAGLPLLSCHGGLSSRLDVVPAAAAATAHGIRLIAPDRPGIGLSDRKEGRTLTDWPDDVSELADHLGLDRFAVMGWSDGGGFAQACGIALPERVTRLGLIASVIPTQWDGMREEVNRLDRLLMELSGRAPVIDRTIFHLMHAAAKHLPKVFAKASGATTAEAIDLSAAVAEGLRNAKGVVDEYRIFDHPWEFDAADITVPTYIWHGTEDDLCPVSWGERLAEAIDGSILTVVPGASHFLWYDHWDDIFSALVP